MDCNYKKILKCCGLILLSFSYLNVVYADEIVPQRSVSIIADSSGYYPKKLAVFAGEKVHLFFTTTNRQNSCFMFDSQSVYLGAKVGEIVESELYFDSPGKFKFYCPQGKIQGEFVVLEPHKRSLQKRQQRTVACDNGENRSVRIWIPSKE
jgi:plastocyanin